MNWTKEQLQAFQAGRGKPKPVPAAGSMRGRIKPQEGMNKTEAAYSRHLEARKFAREILWFAFEPIKIKLAKATFYTPDFLVMRADGTLEVHETKGHWEDDARVKIKVAAELFPAQFIGVRLIKGAWEYGYF